MEHRKNLQKHSISKDKSAPFLDWVKNLHLNQGYFKRFWRDFDKRLRFRWWSLVFIYCLLLSSIVFFEINFNEQVELGQPAASDIKSPISFQVVDERATEEKRKEAEDSIPPVFDYDPSLYEQVLNRVYRAFREMRAELKTVRWPKDENAREEVIKEFVKNKPKFEDLLGVEISQLTFEWLTENRFSPRIENILVRGLLNWSSGKIMDGRGLRFSDEDQKIVVQDPESQGRGQLIPVNEVRDIRRDSDFNLEQVRGYASLSARDKRAITNLARDIRIPNLIYNKKETLEKRNAARAAILPVQISVKKNQLIVAKGSVVQPTHMLLISEINNLQSARRMDYVAIAVALLFFVSIAVFFNYIRRTLRSKLQLEARDFYTMAIVLVLISLITKLYLFIVDGSFVDEFSSTIPASSFLFAAPVAAGPMLVGLLIPYGEMVWLFTLFLSVVVALMVDPSFYFPMLIFSVVGGIAGARGVYSCKKRNDIYWAGIRAGLVNAVIIGVITFLISIREMGFLDHLFWNVTFGFVAGVFSSMVTMTFIPLLESLFNYTTDVKLLELSSLNHPLMKDMIVKAPGTYHHSLVVGSMCEAAAEEIGANPLLAKVMAYYHDIGKMEHAHYFIENQRPGHNPHEHISPHMSKTVLIAHVKDGAEMGYRHKLGKPIIDGIRQHHGTTLISYFFNKAIEEQDEDIDLVHEEDFRYPGPKPQFKEAALLMLADSIEAAARSLDEPTAGRLSSLVRNIIQNKFLDGQLEECNLTLRDLRIIETSFRRVILGIYHQRIDYPESPFNKGLPALPPSPAKTSYSQRKKVRPVSS